MAQLSDNAPEVAGSVIPDVQEAKTMRHLIENKGLLDTKGKLYAGTGDTTSTGAPVTAAVDPEGAADGAVLVKDSTQNAGWKVRKVSPSDMDSWTFHVNKNKYPVLATPDVGGVGEDGIARLGFYQDDADRSLILRANLSGQNEPRDIVLDLPVDASSATLATTNMVNSLQNSVESWQDSVENGSVPVGISSRTESTDFTNVSWRASNSSTVLTVGSTYQFEGYGVVTYRSSPTFVSRWQIFPTTSNKNDISTNANIVFYQLRIDTEGLWECSIEGTLLTGWPRQESAANYVRKTGLQYRRIG